MPALIVLPHSYQWPDHEKNPQFQAYHRLNAPERARRPHRVAARAAMRHASHSPPLGARKAAGGVLAATEGLAGGWRSGLVAIVNIR